MKDVGDNEVLSDVAKEVDLDSLLSSGLFGDTSSLDVCADVAASQIDFSSSDDEIVVLLKSKLGGHPNVDRELALTPQFRYVAHNAALHPSQRITPEDLPLTGWLPANTQVFVAAREPSLKLSVLNAQSDSDVGKVMMTLYDRFIAVPGSPANLKLIDIPTAVVSGIQGGLDILALICPKSAKSNLAHVSLACVYAVDQGVHGDERGFTPCAESVSAAAIKGSIYMFAEAVTEPWLAAELIYHEAIHNKMFDLFISRGILPPGLDRRGCEDVFSEWNERTQWRTNSWPFDQAFGAYHVYVHLMQFFLLSLRQKHSPKLTRHLQSRLGDAIARSASIERQLAPSSEKYLTKSGVEFFNWLRNCRKVIRSQL